MANLIIQNYLSDPTIPKEKKMNVQNDMNGGKSETQIASDITSIYGDRFSTDNRGTSSGNEMSIEEFMQKQETTPGIHYLGPIGPQQAFPDPRERIAIADPEEGRKSERFALFPAPPDNLRTDTCGVPKRDGDRWNHLARITDSR